MPSAKRGFDLSKKIELPQSQIEELCDVLVENSPESLRVSGVTYIELIHRTAIQYKRDVGILSQVDAEGIDPEIQRELIIISQSNFVAIAAGIDLNRSNHEYVGPSFWEDLAHEMKRVYDGNHLNPFAVFSGF